MYTLHINILILFKAYFIIILLFTNKNTKLNKRLSNCILVCNDYVHNFYNYC